jgi:hypothetical protein
MIDELSLNSDTRVTGPFWDGLAALVLPAIILMLARVLVFYLVTLLSRDNRNARGGLQKNLDLLCRLGEIERCVEDARCCRGSCSPNPLIVGCREV